MVTTEPRSPEPRALQRLVQRWAQLPIETAGELTDLVLSLAQQVADATPTAPAERPTPLPDLGPAVVIDQLRVVLYDARLAGADPHRWDSNLDALLSLTYNSSSNARPGP